MTNELRDLYPSTIGDNYTIDSENDGHLVVRAIGGDVVLTLQEASTLQSIGRIYSTRVCLTQDSDSRCIVKTSWSDVFQQWFSEIILNNPGESVVVSGLNDPQNTEVVSRKQSSKKTIYATYSINAPIQDFNNRIESNPLIVPFDELVTNNSQVFSLSWNQDRMTQGIKTMVEAQYYLAFDSVNDSTYVIEAYIRKNGAEIIEWSRTYVGNFGGEDANLTSAIQYLEVLPGDYFELVVFHDWGVSSSQSNVKYVYTTMKTVIN